MSFKVSLSLFPLNISPSSSHPPISDSQLCLVLFFFFLTPHTVSFSPLHGLIPFYSSFQFPALKWDVVYRGRCVRSLSQAGVQVLDAGNGPIMKQSTGGQTHSQQVVRCCLSVYIPSSCWLRSPFFLILLLLPTSTLVLSVHQPTPPPHPPNSPATHCLPLSPTSFTHCSHLLRCSSDLTVHKWFGKTALQLLLSVWHSHTALCIPPVTPFLIHRRCALQRQPGPH